jgi:hypothetical protein
MSEPDTIPELLVKLAFEFERQERQLEAKDEIINGLKQKILEMLAEARS